MGTVKAVEKYAIDSEHECRQVFVTTDPAHPGVKKVMQQGPANPAGSVKVISESCYPEIFRAICQRPAEARKIFEERGDIPAHVRVKAIDMPADECFRKDGVVRGGYPMEMRCAGTREALLHAVVRQSYGSWHLTVGRDHAGLGDYYGPFDTRRYSTRSRRMLWTCARCAWTGHSAATSAGTWLTKTCQRKSKAVIDEGGVSKGGARPRLSGTLLRNLMSEGKPVPAESSEPEVTAVLKEYCDKLEQNAEVKLHG